MDISIKYAGKSLKEEQSTALFHHRGPITGKPLETEWLLHDDSNSGYIQRIHFRDGFDLFMMHYCPKERICMSVDHKRPVFGFGYCISGQMKGTVQGHDQTIYTGGGESCVYYYASRKGAVEDAADQVKRLVTIIIEPAALLSLIGDGFTDLSEHFQGVVSANKTCELDNEQNSMTLSMASILEDIFKCSYRGPIRKLYMESKSMELIALRLQKMLLFNRDSRDQEISSTELQRIYDASDLLCSDLEFPPTLFELPGKVGLSHTRLNRGFRQVFETTVFGYLRRKRLDRAKWLMEEQSKNVTEAAFSVGYRSLSSFSRAFQNQFGINPTQCLGKR